MNLSGGHQFLDVHPLSYVIFCRFLSTPSLLPAPILCRKKIYFAPEIGGVTGSLTSFEAGSFDSI